MFLVLDSIFGLPAHALVVHLAVIIVPLAAVAFIATGWRAHWRRAYSLPVAILAVAGAGASLMAAQTGGPLESMVRNAARSAGTGARFGEHPENGNTAELFAIVLAVAAVAFWAVDRYGERWKLPRWAPVGAYAVAVVPAVIALVTMAVAGHSGAQLVWKDVGTFTVAR